VAETEAKKDYQGGGLKGTPNSKGKDFGITDELQVQTGRRKMANGEYKGEFGGNSWAEGALCSVRTSSSVLARGGGGFC